MDPLIIAGKSFQSRLMVGTGKFASPDLLEGSLDAAATEIVTVALRRVDLSAPGHDVLQAIDRERYWLLPNTSGATNAAEAIQLARLAREAGLGDWVKLEVIPDARYLLPDGPETLKATSVLVKEGFTVLPYMQADPLLARQLQDAGAATVMPLGSPIGTNQGLQTRLSVAMIIEQSQVPVVVDAGLGLPSHACEAMELGADAVLVNTAIATASDPVAMAQAFAYGVNAGRAAYCAGQGALSTIAQASSPLTGFLE